MYWRTIISVNLITYINLTIYNSLIFYWKFDTISLMMYHLAYKTHVLINDLTTQMNKQIYVND